MAKRRKKGEWIVTMRCRVTVEIYCHGCTEDEARDDPYSHCGVYSESVIDSVDVAVIDVVPNE